jgi:hypothetical protein
MKDFSPRLRRIILGLFILASLITVLRHEMWRDELHSWLLAKDNPTLAEVGRDVRYEKHPLAWYIVLFLLTRLTNSPLSMQLFHLALASLSASLVLRYAPFHPYQKVLLIFGYYLFFEFNIISRNYALGILSLFLFCVFYTRRPDRPLLWGTCLFVLANTSFYGLILAFAAGATAALDVLIIKKLRRRWTSWAALCLAVLGAVFSLLTMAPVPDSSYDQVAARHTSFSPETLSRVLHVLPRSYFPIPRFTLQFWNTNILDRAAPELPVNLVVALVIVIFAVALLRRHRSALVFFVLATAGILGWSYFASSGFVRHQGHLFIAFITALWLTVRPAEGDDKQGGEIGCQGIRPKYLRAGLAFLFAIQFLAGLYAAGMDFLFPFSRAKETATFIKKHGYRDLPIVGEMDYLMTPVSGYLGRKVYFVRGERIGSYVKFDMKRFQNVRPEHILTRAEQFAWRKQKDCLILLNFTLDPRWEQPGRLVKLLSTGPAIVGSEAYRLYLWKYTGPRGPQ